MFLKNEDKNRDNWERSYYILIDGEVPTDVYVNDFMEFDTDGIHGLEKEEEAENSFWLGSYDLLDTRDVERLFYDLSKYFKFFKVIDFMLSGGVPIDILHNAVAKVTSEYATEKRRDKYIE